MQFNAVVIDQFDRQHDQSLVHIALKCFKASQQELCQLAREGNIQLIFKLIFIMVDNACFRCIGYNKAQRIDLSYIDVIFIIDKRTYDILNRCDLTCFLIWFAIDSSSELKSILAILFLKVVYRSKGDWLYQDNTSVEQTFFVCQIDLIVHKRS